MGDDIVSVGRARDSEACQQASWCKFTSVIEFISFWAER